MFIKLCEASEDDGARKKKSAAVQHNLLVLTAFLILSC